MCFKRFRSNVEADLASEAQAVYAADVPAQVYKLAYLRPSVLLVLLRLLVPSPLVSSLGRRVYQMCATVCPVAELPRPTPSRRPLEDMCMDMCAKRVSACSLHVHMHM